MALAFPDTSERKRVRELLSLLLICVMLLLIHMKGGGCDISIGRQNQNSLIPIRKISKRKEGKKKKEKKGVLF